MNATVIQAPCDGTGSGRPGVEQGDQPTYELASGSTIVDAQQQVAAHIRRRSTVQGTALNIVELELDLDLAGTTVGERFHDQ